MTDQSIIWKRQMIAADVYDCYSLKAAEKTGYTAACLSADGIAECVCGLKDPCQLSAEEFLWAAKRIISFSPIPVIAQIQNGFGILAESAARTAGRLAKAGANAVWIDDSRFQEPGHVNDREWEMRIRAVRDALGTDHCRLICTVSMDEQMPLEEAAGKCLAAARLGAHITGISGLKNLEDAEKFSGMVKGPKVWIDAKKGTVKAKELETLGYQLILNCYSVQSAREGMELFGRQTQADQHTVFHDQHDFDGMLPSLSHYDLFEFYKTWIPLEQRFLNAASAAQTTAG